MTSEEHEHIYRLFASPATQKKAATTDPAAQAPSNTTEAAPPPVSELPPLTVEAFTAFLQSVHNQPFIEPERHVNSKLNPEAHLNHPLSHYFINSSHNTYLVGNQLVGESSVEGYIRALLAGSRSVELDIYDGPDASKAVDPDEKDPAGNAAAAAVSTPATLPAKNDGQPDSGDIPGDWGAGILPFDYTGIIPTEPVVTHGGTLTTSLSVRSICQAINRYAFVTSDYPVIISAEIHCSVNQQKVLVREFINIFLTSNLSFLANLLDTHFL